MAVTSMGRGCAIMGNRDRLRLCVQSQRPRPRVPLSTVRCHSLSSLRGRRTVHGPCFLGCPTAQADAGNRDPGFQTGSGFTLRAQRFARPDPDSPCRASSASPAPVRWSCSTQRSATALNVGGENAVACRSIEGLLIQQRHTQQAGHRRGLRTDAGARGHGIRGHSGISPDTPTDGNCTRVMITSVRALWHRHSDIRWQPRNRPDLHRRRGGGA